MKDFDTVLVGFDHSHGDPAVLIVGRKAPRDNVQIINQFQGKEAEELYQKLVGEEKKVLIKGWAKLTLQFGTVKDYPFLMGLQLGFSMSGSGVMDGCKYTVNMSPAGWEVGTRHTTLRTLDFVEKSSEQRKLLILGSPLSALEDGVFKFRILTEVL